ncbi:hypothetical protein JFL43_11140 [Viridibacillus sp. YIM B01967]|uniref:Uncharacterized protein n=1 Tax=Viridibacillus soli TaxID=2798301 RepID=A0ABS1H8Q3_9BACL|nr:hypothetical protein [Viridibacillus soli]MBK3495393.1 hypothetical protein [Viridibacillus soli]
MGKKMFFYLDPKERQGTVKVPSNPVFEGTFLMVNHRLIDSVALEDYCPNCLGLLRYSDEYDSLFCVNCNEWREEECDDPTCDSCKDRPKRPF